MRINTLTLGNFRQFREHSLELGAGLTLIVGDNGQGKSSILDALAIAAGSFFLGLPSVSTRHIRDNDIRWNSHEPSSGTFPVRVKAEGTVDGESMEWARAVEYDGGRTTWQDAKRIKQKAAEMHTRVKRGAPVVLPLVAYYGTGRLWFRKRETESYEDAAHKRYVGYWAALEPASAEKRLLAWFRKTALEEAANEQGQVALRAVEAAILSCVEGSRAVVYDREWDELLIEFENSQLPFDLLSDGYRNLIGLAADLAYRASTLNPDLGVDAVQRTPGIVLVDELDLHLHPKWQRRVVNDLISTFPSLQIIATSHSPFIIQGLDRLERTTLINLDPNIGALPTDRTIEDIAELIQNVPMPQRSARFQAMVAAAERYYQTLENLDNASPESITTAKNELDRLTRPFSDDPGYHAWLSFHRNAGRVATDRRRRE